MPAIVVIGLIGFVAQLVDGSLGMGYGVTSTTLLLSAGLSPAVASASVHLAELGTTLASGTAHWRFGNVHWGTVRMLALPGGIGAFMGAYVLSSISADVAKPWVSLALASLGVVILVRSLWGRSIAARPARPRLRSLGPLGIFAGFLDAAGGGGWGPVTTTTLMAGDRLPPRQVIGTVSASEFVVTVGASLGFLLGLGTGGYAWDAVAVLLAGGLVAAPLAAWLVRRIEHRTMGIVVAGMILYSNIDRVLSLVGADSVVAETARLAIVFCTVGLVTGLTMGRRSHPPADQPVVAPA